MQSEVFGPQLSRFTPHTGWLRRTAPGEVASPRNREASRLLTQSGDGNRPPLRFAGLGAGAREDNTNILPSSILLQIRYPWRQDRQPDSPRPNPDLVTVLQQPAHPCTPGRRGAQAPGCSRLSDAERSPDPPPPAGTTRPERARKVRERADIVKLFLCGQPSSGTLFRGCASGHLCRDQKRALGSLRASKAVNSGGAPSDRQPTGEKVSSA